MNKFYKANRGRARAKSSDKVWVIRQSGHIVGALRVVPLNGHEFLTGVQVAIDKQGQGIATCLLTQTFQRLYQSNNPKPLVKPCYTFPYRYLVDFYARLGWQRIAMEDLPKPLQTRFLRYQRQGRDICVMKFMPKIELNEGHP